MNKYLVVYEYQSGGGNILRGTLVLQTDCIIVKDIKVHISKHLNLTEGDELIILNIIKDDDRQLIKEDTCPE